MPGRVFRFDQYTVDFERRELRRGGIRVGLQQKPFRVLELLLRCPGELVSRQELISFLWPDSHVSFAHGLNTAVNSLRLALRESSHEALFIETRPGLGYRFNAAVEEVFDRHLKPMLPHEPGTSRDAHRDCLKGWYLLDRITAQETYKAIAFFQSAATEDECRSLAHCGIADAYCQLALLRVTSAAELTGKARSATFVALSNGPDLATAHVSDGRVKMIFDWDLKGAQEAVRRALALNASSPSAHLLQAALLISSGRYEDALRSCREAISLDPLSFSANLQLAACLFAARDFRRTVEQCWSILTLVSQFAPAQLMLALAYEQLEMFEEATVEFENAERCAGFEADARSGLVHLLAMTGLSNAQKSLPALAGPGQECISLYGCALLYAAQGQKDQAIFCLEECFRKRHPPMLWVGADPRFDSVREDERFRRLVAAMASSS